MIKVSSKVEKCRDLKDNFLLSVWKSPYLPISKKVSSYNLAKSTLKRLFEIANVRQVTFAGGEPMLSEHFLRLVEYCCNENKIVSIVSNGNVGSKDDYKQLLNAGVLFFEFPFFSITPSTHDYLTNRLNSWFKTLNSIKTVLSLGGRVFALILITKQNYSEVDETIEFLASIGITEIAINRFNIGGSGFRNISDLLPSKTQLLEGFRKINTIAGKLKLNIISMVGIPWCLLDPNEPYC